MHHFKKALVVLCAMFVGFGHAMAATTTVETFTFDATLASGSLLCGDFVGSEVSCPSKFGTYSGNPYDDFMFGKSLGGTYAGQIRISSDGLNITDASCQLGGADCAFSTDFLTNSVPVGANASLDFSSTSVVQSLFQFSGATGDYFFGTDYLNDPDGIHYYFDVRFDLSDVSYGVAEVPLPGSVGFLAAALGGFAAFKRRKGARALRQTV